MTNSISPSSSSLGLNPSFQLSRKEIEQKLAALTHRDIQVLSDIVTDRILKFLGPVAKQKICMEVEGPVKQPESREQWLLRKIREMNAQEEPGSFLSGEKARNFRVAAQEILGKQIAQELSRPAMIWEFGILFRMSDYHPMGPLAEVSQKAGISITLLDVPRRYQIQIALDKETTAKSGELCFILHQSSDGKVFDKQHFTLADHGKFLVAKL